MRLCSPARCSICRGKNILKIFQNFFSPTPPPTGNLPTFGPVRPRPSNHSRYPFWASGQNNCEFDHQISKANGNYSAIGMCREKEKARKHRYYQAHKERLKENAKRPEIKARKANEQRTRRAKVKQLTDGVKLHYGCCNPNCPIPVTLEAYCYDFHHINAVDKVFTISMNKNSFAQLPRIWDEINKCTVLCSVCHRREQNGHLDVSTFPKCHVDEHGNPKTQK